MEITNDLIQQLLEKSNIDLTDQETKNICDFTILLWNNLNPTEKNQEKLLTILTSTIVFAKRITIGDACHYSAALGHINLIQLAHDAGCIWDTNTTKEAALHGHLECLKWLHEHDCPWDSSIFGEMQFLKSIDVDDKKKENVLYMLLKMGVHCIRLF